MFRFFKKFREVVVEENDVMDIMKVFNSTFGYFNGSVGNCGWKLEPTKWFIQFFATDKQYSEFINDLNRLGCIKLNTEAPGKIYVYFERNNMKMGNES